MIKSFKDRRLKRLYERGDRSRIAPEMGDKVENILAVLDRARRIQAVDLPGFRSTEERSGRPLEHHSARQLADRFSLRETAMPSTWS